MSEIVVANVFFSSDRQTGIIGGTPNTFSIIAGNTTSLIANSTSITLNNVSFSSNVGFGNNVPTNPVVISDKSGNPMLFLTASNSLFTPVYGAQSFGNDPGLIMRKAGGTAAAPTATATDARLGYVIGSTSADGITWYNTTAMNFYAEVTANSTSQPTYINFMTTANGAVARTERMRIVANGNVGIGNSAPGHTLKVQGNISDVHDDVRSIPVNSQTTSYQLASTDNGRVVSSNAGVTVNGAVIVANQAFTIFNNSAANITITQGAGATMYLSGTANTGNRTLAQRGLATIICYAANSFVITGTGVT